MEDIVLLWLIGVRVVLVHGGGPEINELMGRLGKKAEFVDGLRVTGRETVDIVQMVLAGKVNKTLVNLSDFNKKPNKKRKGAVLKTISAAPL